MAVSRRCPGGELAAGASGTLHIVERHLARTRGGDLIVGAATAQSAPTTMKDIASPRTVQSCPAYTHSGWLHLHLSVSAGTSTSFLYRPLNTPPSATGRFVGQTR